MLFQNHEVWTKVREMPPLLHALGSNDRIAVAVIGLERCHSDIYPGSIQLISSEANVRLAAICDFSRARLEWPARTFHVNEADLFTDYRRVLERDDIDAVIVGTPDHLHARICLEALEASKHVLCQSPLTRYLGEAFRVHDRVKESGKVFQFSPPGCSAEGWRKCGELVSGGRIGILTRAQTSYCRNSYLGEWNYLIEPAVTAGNIDWERWLGPVKRKAFSAEHFCRWRKYYEYSAGLLSDLAPLRLCGLLLGSGESHFPVRVACTSSHRTDADGEAQTPPRTVPSHVLVQAEFPGGFVLSLTCSSVCAHGPPAMLFGHKGTLQIGFGGDRVELFAEEAFASEINSQVIEGLKGEDMRAHLKNWFECIRSGAKPNGDIDLALRVQTVISLAEMSDRLKMTCLFDAATRRVSDASGAEIEPLTYGMLD